jgi:hypothetical protein
MKLPILVDTNFVGTIHSFVSTKGLSGLLQSNKSKKEETEESTSRHCFGFWVLRDFVILVASSDEC